MEADLHKRIEQRHQVGLRHSSTLPIQYFPIAEEHQCRDGADVVLGSHIVVSIHIHLDDAKLVAHRLLQVFQYRVHHFAWLAPCRKEINQYQLIARYYFIECFHYFSFQYLHYLFLRERILVPEFHAEVTTPHPSDTVSNHQTA